MSTSSKAAHANVECSGSFCVGAKVFIIMNKYMLKWPNEMGLSPVEVAGAFQTL